MNVSGLTNKELDSFSFIHRDGEQRAYVNQEGLARIVANGRTLDSLIKARNKAERDAITNLGRYKFSNFGYHAARWVTLTHIIGDKKANPFRFLVKAAREAARPSMSSRDVTGADESQPASKLVSGVLE